MFTKTRTQQLQNLLVTYENKVWTLPELNQILNVNEKWSYTNKAKLEAMGFSFERKVHKEHKAHKEHKEHSHKGMTKYVDEREVYTTIDLTTAHRDSFKCHLFLRLYINILYTKYGLVAPFYLETEETTKDQVIPQVLDLLNERIVNEAIDIEAILTNMLNVSDDLLDTYDKKSLDYLDKFPLDYTVYLSVLSNSLSYLRPLTISAGNRVTIERAFLHLHGFTPTEEQIQCVAKVQEFLANRRLRSASIQSDAGSSKSTTALVIQYILSDINPLITAKTNKALNKFIHSKTLSRVFIDLMGSNTMKDGEELQLTKAEKYRGTIDFIIVDEASMVSLHERLLLETLCQKVLYIGDKEQMKPVGGKLAYNFTYLHTLQTQYRFMQAETDFQIKYTYYNKNKRLVSANNLLKQNTTGTFKGQVKHVNQENGNIELQSFYDKSFNDYHDLFKTYKDNNYQIIAFSQNAVDTINSIINEGLDFKIGSKVVLNLNDYKQSQYNGFQYLIENIVGEEYTCRAVETNEVYTFNKTWIDLAYAITTLKAQGSQWDHVLCIDGTSSTFDRSRDRYVLVTRGAISSKILQKDFSKKATSVSIKNIV